MTERESEIAAVAYEIWVRGGFQDGMAEQNWLEAERQVMKQMADASNAATSGAAREIAAHIDAAETDRK